MTARTAPTARTATRRRALGLVLAVVAVAGLSVASAAQLDTAPGTLQAGTGTVASCQPEGQPIGVGFTTTFSSGQYRATAVRLTGVSSACNGESVRVRLLRPDGSAVAGIGDLVGPSVAVPAPSGTVTVPMPSTPVQGIGGVAVAIG